jgi:hypothetical protein
MGMKRDRAVDATLWLPGIKRPVGRPPKADVLSNAQRQKKWRKRRKELISVMRNENSSDLAEQG